MKDEIKEILDKPKILMLSCGNYISLDDYVKLKDYITNLQTIEQQYSAILSENAELENKITNLQEKNKMYKKEKDALMNSLFITRNKYNNDKARYRGKAKNYKTRNEKAIEKCKNKQYETNASWLIKFAKDVENILQGKSDE